MLYEEEPHPPQLRADLLPRTGRPTQAVSDPALFRRALNCDGSSDAYAAQLAAKEPPSNRRRFDKELRSAAPHFPPRSLPGDALIEDQTSYSSAATAVRNSIKCTALMGVAPSPTAASV